MNYWRLRNTVKYIIHPFKYGFWCQMCIGKMPLDKFIKLAMFWETYDSYAGDGDYGLVYAWTGNRKTWKELKYYKKLGMDDDGFVFTVPFFIAWLLVLPGTIIEYIKQIREYNRYSKDWRKSK